MSVRGGAGGKKGKKAPPHPGMSYGPHLFLKRRQISRTRKFKPNTTPVRGGGLGRVAGAVAPLENRAGAKLYNTPSHHHPYFKSFFQPIFFQISKTKWSKSEKKQEFGGRWVGTPLQVCPHAKVKSTASVQRDGLLPGAFT